MKGLFKMLLLLSSDYNKTIQSKVAVYGIANKLVEDFNFNIVRSESGPVINSYSSVILHSTYFNPDKFSGHFEWISDEFYTLPDKRIKWFVNSNFIERPSTISNAIRSCDIIINNLPNSVVSVYHKPTNITITSNSKSQPNSLIDILLDLTSIIELNNFNYSNHFKYIHYWCNTTNLIKSNPILVFKGNSFELFRSHI